VLDDRTASEYRTENDLEGSGVRLIEVRFWNVPGQTEEHTEEPQPR
jgi:hypothetical protein